MEKIFFYEAFDEEVSALRQCLPKNSDAGFTWKTIQEQGDARPPAALISIRTQSRVPGDWGKMLKGVLTRSQGYDHLAGFRRGSGEDVPCGFLDNYCARAVAEQAAMMMMALLRKFKKQAANFTTFSRNGITGSECRGRRALVAGVGHIGGEIADVVKGLRMEVKGFDIDPKVKDLSYVSLTEGAAWADVIFCALPLTEETRGMMGYHILKGGSAGKIFVNVSRGEISPVEDLKKLLDEGALGGIALDVFPNEDELAGTLRAGAAVANAGAQAWLDLARKENIVFTPHNAFNTSEALKKKASLTVDAMDYFSARGTFPNPVP